MSKPKYIALVILSLLFSVAWLLGLYVSLGLSENVAVYPVAFMPDPVMVYR